MRHGLVVRSLSFSALGVAAALLGCTAGSSPGKGGEEARFDDYEAGKGDSYYTPTEHGELEFGIPQRARLGEETRFHVWDFTLSAGANVTLETSPPDFDTVMYLYRRNTETDSWGHYIARNDDYSERFHSRIADELGAGTYRVLVKGYKEALRGEFRIEGHCTGEGCAEPVASCNADALDVVSLCIEEGCQDALDSTGHLDFCLNETCHDDFDHYDVPDSCVSCAVTHAVEVGAPGTQELGEACGTEERPDAPVCDVDGLEVMQLCVQEACQTAIDNGWDLRSCINENCHDDIEFVGVSEDCVQCAAEHGPEGVEAIAGHCG